MKTISTLTFLLLFTVVLIAQDKVFTHTADLANISSDLTVIDHPDLNGNSGAFFISTHNLNAGGLQYNNNVTGAYYNGSNWGVYNESGVGIVEGSSYNIYIPVGGNVTTVQANGSSYDLELDNAAINGNPNAVLVYGTYFNPSDVRNDYNYGFYYNDTSERWHIFNEETVTNIPTDAAFNILIDDGTGGADYFVHNNTVELGGNYTIIDHASLNGKPNAYPIVSHNWGTGGDSSNIILNSPIGVWYDGTNWTIYTEDTSTMLLNTRFNVYVAAEALGTDDNASLDISLYPNPANDHINITSKEVITAVSIYNILGQEVSRFEGNNVQMKIDVSTLSEGTYIAKIQVEDAVSVNKFLKL